MTIAAVERALPLLALHIDLCSTEMHAGELGPVWNFQVQTVYNI
ncbi:MAG TPA: hypothetical protein VJO14_08735 [Bacteroidota bacterium]|nr:hypothetical protein [Bacteroidota bacterium]